MTETIVRRTHSEICRRKLSEERLEHESNSRDARQEASEALIAGQRSEGRLLVRDR